MSAGGNYIEMKPSTESSDSSFKLWLAAFVATAAGTVAFFVFAFTHPSEEPETVNVPLPAMQSQSVAVMTPRPANSLILSPMSSPQKQSVEASLFLSPVTTASTVEAKMARWVQEVPLAEREEMVHRQADYFRGLLAEAELHGKKPQLTLEQINKMERSGRIIW